MTRFLLKALHCIKNFFELNPIEPKKEKDYYEERTCSCKFRRRAEIRRLLKA